MYRQKVLVKSLQIVETFNSVSVIATDKTGTLTKNQMTVTHLLWDTDGLYTFPIVQSIETPSEQEDQGLELTQRNNPSAISQLPGDVIRDLLLGACLCNNAEEHFVANVELGQKTTDLTTEKKIVGDAADTAMYNMCIDACQIDIIRTRSTNRRLRVLPFNSNVKFMISANEIDYLPSNVLITLKGAPDIVIQRCSTYKTKDGTIENLTNEIRQAIIQRQETFGKDGYRLIAMCQQTVERQVFNEDYNDELPMDNYTFIGLFALIDPPRAEVPEAVLKARHAGIRVAMVTGDHPTTARSIASQVNIFSSDIARQNGIDTFTFELNERGKEISRLYRNDQFLEEHELTEVTTINLNLGVNNQNHEEQSTPPWYRRVFTSCRNQFTDPVSKRLGDDSARLNYIPYGVIVRFESTDFFLSKYFLFFSG